jgi:hypothetical protein
MVNRNAEKSGSKIEVEVFAKSHCRGWRRRLGERRAQHGHVICGPITKDLHTLTLDYHLFLTTLFL